MAVVINSSNDVQITLLYPTSSRTNAVVMLLRGTTLGDLSGFACVLLAIDGEGEGSGGGEVVVTCGTKLLFDPRRRAGVGMMETTSLVQCGLITPTALSEGGRGELLILAYLMSFYSFSPT